MNFGFVAAQHQQRQMYLKMNTQSYKTYRLRELYLTPGTRENEDLLLVMHQTDSSREDALNALLYHRGDMVNAIVELTS